MFDEKLNGTISHYDKNLCPVAEGTGAVRRRVSFARLNDFVTRITLEYINTGTESEEYIPVYERAADWECDFYMIPCVNYNGNRFGSGEEPKGMRRGGEPWIFPAERTGLAGASIIERAGECFALFAEGSGISKNASSSVFQRDGKTVQRVYFSHIEYPAVYLRKFVYGEPTIEKLRLEGGASHTFVCYSYHMKDGAKGVYAYEKLFDFVNENLSAIPAAYSLAQIREWNFGFVRSLTEETDGKVLSNMGLLPEGEHRLGDESCKFIYRKFGKYEVGWCGQNITVAEIYLREYLKSGKKEYLRLGKSIVASWLERRYPSGLSGVNYDVPFDGSERIDLCNEGWLLYKLCILVGLYKEAEEDFAPLVDAVKGICGCIFARYPDALPQVVAANGDLIVAEGCAGAIFAAGVLQAYLLLKEEKYLVMGKRYFGAYYEKYLARSICAGGALDTYCVDKESAGPVLRAAIMLYEITGKGGYLEKAEHIAHYLMSWAYYFDVGFGADTDCGRLGLRTTGGTSVSAAHHHIDCWGIFYVPDFYSLYRLTGNRAYLNHAIALWTFTLQYMSDGSLCLHGMTRPRGAQNEAVICCNWHDPAEERGQLNDWLVAWVKTFQLDVVYALENTDFFSFVK